MHYFEDELGLISPDYEENLSLSSNKIAVFDCHSGCNQ